MKFIDLLNEVIEIADVNTEVQDKPASFMASRFQPDFDSTHNNTLKRMLVNGKGDKFVFVIRGKITSKDKSRYPSNKSAQVSTVKAKIGNKAKVIVVPDGFIGTFINELRNRGFEPKEFYLGPNQEFHFLPQLQRYKSTFNSKLKLKNL